MHFLNYDAYISALDRMCEKPEDPNYIKVAEASSVFDGVKVCSFTGHRPEKLGITEETDDNCLELKIRLREEILSAIESGYTAFISGMARGADMWAAEAVLEAIHSGYGEVKLYAAIPYPEQTRKWFGWEKDRYEEILRLCEGVFLVSDVYNSRCMAKRNEFLVKHCDRLIAVYNGTEGGTANTVALAKKRGKDIVLIEPRSVDNVENQM